jgi:hypothetical protein
MAQIIKVIDCKHCGSQLGQVVLEDKDKIQIQLTVNRIEMPAGRGQCDIKVVCHCGEKTDLKMEEIREIPVHRNKTVALFPAEFGDTKSFVDSASAHSYR